MCPLGQIVLVLISILFTSYQSILHQEPFFTLDFFLFTFIAWVVGILYDRNRNLAKKARYSELNYKNLLDTFPESICIHRHFKILYVNDACVSMMGSTSKDELIGQSLIQFINPEYKERLIERAKIVIKEKKPLTTIEHNFIRKDGSSFYFEVASMFIMFGNKGAVLSIGKDVTDRKEETDRMIQKSEKLAMLGQMAAGIAHEIRNPLTSIKGFLQLLRVNHPEQQYFSIILSELERINHIVGEFLVLSKPTVVAYMEQDVKELITDVVTLINTQSILNNIQILVKMDSELPSIICEKNQVKQVLLNVLKNAIEAMPTGGIIELKAQVRERGLLLIKIKDQGIGIPVDRMSTLGEPFYTTKEKGTGLGLMTCFKIIEEHKGQLLFHSEINEGTTVEILLPTSTQPLIKQEISV
ncbi:PAS domain S-box protein [Bacillus sp. BGMRC 2118]|nr:PAS domain S-box protein [Bacillus sp. BGMRC 2118]